MSATEVAERTTGENTAIRPFKVGFSEEELIRAAPAHQCDPVAGARDG